MQQIEREIDQGLETLAASKDAWGRLPLERKIGLLEAVHRCVFETSPDWVAAAVSAKGLQPESPLAGEEWISGPWAVLYALTRYLRTLTGLSLSGEVPLPAMRRRADGTTVLDAFPHDAYDRLLLNGIRAEVWMQAGVTPERARASAASFYRRPLPQGRVALVLGAGNISSIAPLDVLYKLISDGAVCMLKMNPVNDYLGPILERALQPLLEAGFLRFAYGGADVGAYLCAHPAVDEIHITGSEQTHNAIAFGAAAGKPITSELGNVSPTIVVPGRWSAADLQFQAENIATQKAHNAGFNCIAAQVLILPRDWPHSQTLRERIASVFSQIEQRREYYPGAAQRRAAMTNAPTPFSLVALDPQQREHPAFQSEAFCGVLGYVELPGSLDEYVRDAVAFANDNLRGTLGANIVVHPKTMRSHRAPIDKAVSDLRYGCIGVNAWTGVGYFITETPWGAYPGHTLYDIGSGIGVVHNSYLLEQTLKSVVYAPFKPFPRSVISGEYSLLPRPPWFVTNKMAARIGRALCEFEAARSPARALDIAALAMRG